MTLSLLLAPRAEAAPHRWVAPVVATTGAVLAHASKLASHGQAAAFGVGLGVGVYVTQKLHASNGFWAKRIPGTRYRYADLPVGGTVAFGAALLARNHPGLSHMLIAAGMGMTAGAVGTGIADPLPRK